MKGNDPIGDTAIFDWTMELCAEVFLNTLAAESSRIPLKNPHMEAAAEIDRFKKLDSLTPLLWKNNNGKLL